MRSIRRLLPPLVLVLASLPALAAARTWYVSATGDDVAGNGSSSAPFATVGHAASVAADGDTVRVRPGLYRECVNASGRRLSFVATASEVNPPSSLVTIVDGTGTCGGNSCEDRKSIACYGPSADYCKGFCNNKVCSVTKTRYCVVDAECPTGETCTATVDVGACTNDRTASCTPDTCEIPTGQTKGTCKRHPTVECLGNGTCANLDCDFGSCSRIEGTCSVSGAWCSSSADCPEGESCDPLTVAPVFDLGTGSTLTGFTVYGGGFSGVRLAGSGTISRNRIASNRATGSDGGAILLEPAQAAVPAACWGNTALACTGNPGCLVCRDDPAVTCAVSQDCIDAGAGSVCVQWGPCLLATEVRVENNAIRDNVADAAGPGHGGGGVFLRTVTFPDSGTRLVASGNEMIRNAATGSGGALLALASGEGRFSVSVEDNSLGVNAAQDGGAVAVVASLGGDAAQADVVLNKNAIVANDAAGRGGGAVVDLGVAGGARITASGNVVELNTAAADGGGMLLRVAGDGPGQRRVDATLNLVSGNRAGGSGGGLDLALLHGPSSAEAGSLAASGNTIAGNTAVAGGGLRATLSSGGPGAGGSMVVETSTIWKNSATSFGAGAVLAIESEGASGASARFSRNLVAENVATKADTDDATGGGLFLYLRGGEGQAGTAVDFCTIAANRSDEGAAAIEIESDGAPGGSARVDVSNSILANNVGMGIGGPLARDDGKMQQGGERDLGIHVAYTDVFGNTRVDFERTLEGELTVDDTVISGDPKLVDDYALGRCSAAIDTADPAADYSTEPQPNGGRSNLGHLGGTASAKPTLPDLDGDGQVDGKDLLWVTTAFASDRALTPARYFAPADVDLNGTVDGDDLAFVAAFFGLACP